MQTASFGLALHFIPLKHQSLGYHCNKIYELKNLGALRWIICYLCFTQQNRLFFNLNCERSWATWGGLGSCFRWPTVSDLLELQEVTKTVHKIYFHRNVLNAHAYIKTIALNVFNPLTLRFREGRYAAEIQFITWVMFMPTSLLYFNINNTTMLTLLENFKKGCLRFGQLVLLPQKLFQIHKTHFSHK